MDKLVENTQFYRQDIISYVYRLTGSIEEAKDITQETMLRYLSTKNDDIKNTKSWMFKVATNLSLDFFRSARNKKETYIGTWLPEPYIEEQSSIENDMQLDESLSVALLVLMEKLSVRERIAYILHDLFEFKHKEIALILDTSIENSRQLNSRANKKLKSDKNRFIPSKEEHIKLTNSFIKALKEGDFEGLKEIFKSDVALYSDGGGKAIAARKVIYGDNNFVSKFLIKVTSGLFDDENSEEKIKTVWFNGSLGVLLVQGDEVISSYNFEINDGKIANIFALRNPDKLKLFQEV